MGTAIFILVLFTAIAGLVKVLSERVQWLKRYSWHVALLIEVVGILIAVVKYLEQEPRPEPVDKVEIADAVWEAVEPLYSQIDSLKQLVMCMAQDPDRINNECYVEARHKAEYIDSADLAKSALDSMLVAIGLGEYDRAISLHDETLAAASHDSSETAWVYFYTGVAYEGAGNYEKFLLMCDSAVAYKRDLYRAWTNRGAALYKLGRYADAISSYDSAITYKHDDYAAWNNMGATLHEIGRYDEATMYYDSALVYNTCLHDALYNRGLALIALVKLEEAQANIDMMEKCNCRVEDISELRHMIQNPPIRLKLFRCDE